MSDDEFDDVESSEGWKNVRAELKALKEAKDASDAELAKFRAVEREQAIKAALTRKGLPEKAASFYNGDASEDAVSKWVEEHADVFGVAPGSTPGGAPDANAQAAARLAAASGGGNGYTEPALGDNRRVYGDPAELLAKVNGDQRLPYEELVRLGLLPDPKRDPFRRPARD